MTAPISAARLKRDADWRVGFAEGFADGWEARIRHERISSLSDRGYGSDEQEAARLDCGGGASALTPQLDTLSRGAIRPEGLPGSPQPAPQGSQSSACSTTEAAEPARLQMSDFHRMEALALKARLGAVAQPSEAERVAKPISWEEDPIPPFLRTAR